MIREIKFRAWVRFMQRMSRVDELNLDSGSALVNEYPYAIESDAFVLMQYTGLKDRNGVEIYEGDIIPYEGKNYAVEMCGPSWSFPEFVGVDYYGHDEPELQDWSQFEVIGNIHENPELLK